MGQLGLFGWVFAVALAISVGCNSAPTLPLPPPVVDVGLPNEAGLVRVTGEVNPDAFVFVFNERLELGVISRADDEGVFSVEIKAAPFDLLTVWQEHDGVSGEQKQTTVPAPEPEPEP